MKFQKGQSGNPNGRKKGVCKVKALRDAIMEHVPDIIDTLLLQAKSGDTQAAKLILERVLPALKSTTPSIALPVDSSDLLKAGKAVIDATTNGTIPTDNGSVLMGMLAQQAKLIETNELITRIETLEAASELKNASKKWTLNTD